MRISQPSGNSLGQTLASWNNLQAILKKLLSGNSLEKNFAKKKNIYG